MQQQSWDEHNKSVAAKSLPPATTLLKALEYLDTVEAGSVKKQAIDLGAGNGIDTYWLLEKGWHVLAIDKEKAVLEELVKHAVMETNKKLSIQIASFEEMQLPAATLINASFSIPFCSPLQFVSVWEAITTAIDPGGIFSGHFFGMNDSWSSRKDMTFYKREQLEMIFKGFTFLAFEETEKEGRTIGGAPKHWHVFHVVALKNKNVSGS